MVTSSENPDRTQRCSFRKVSKPLMEKKRRARINVSLEQLKSLLEKHYTQNIRKRKLEKADILELTVKYLKTIQSAAPGASYVKSAEYQSGFRNCLYGVSQFLLRSEDASETLYLRLLQELGRALPAAGSPFRTLDSGLAAPGTQQHPGALGLELGRALPAVGSPFRTLDSGLGAPGTQQHPGALGLELGRTLPAAGSPFRTLDSGLGAPGTQQHPGALGLELQGLEKDVNSRGPQGLGSDRATPHGSPADRAPQELQNHCASQVLADRIPQRLTSDSGPSGVLAVMLPHAIRTELIPQGFLTGRGTHGQPTGKTLIAADPKPVHPQGLKTDSSPHAGCLPFPANNQLCVPEVGSPGTPPPTESVWRPW